MSQHNSNKNQNSLSQPTQPPSSLSLSLTKPNPNQPNPFFLTTSFFLFYLSLCSFIRSPLPYLLFSVPFSVFSPLPNRTARFPPRHHRLLHLLLSCHLLSLSLFLIYKLHAPLAFFLGLLHKNFTPSLARTRVRF